MSDRSGVTIETQSKKDDGDGDEVVKHDGWLTVESDGCRCWLQAVGAWRCFLCVVVWEDLLPRPR